MNEMHVIPRGDLVEHESSDACVCGPTVQPVDREDGSTGYVYTHHSLDGREAREGIHSARVKGRTVWRTKPDGSLDWVTAHLTKWGARRAAAIYERTGRVRGVRP